MFPCDCSSCGEMKLPFPFSVSNYHIVTTHLIFSLPSKVQLCCYKVEIISYDASCITVNYLIVSSKLLYIGFPFFFFFFKSGRPHASFISYYRHKAKAKKVIGLLQTLKCIYRDEKQLRSPVTKQALIFDVM